MTTKSRLKDAAEVELTKIGLRLAGVKAAATPEGQGMTLNILIRIGDVRPVSSQMARIHVKDTPEGCYRGPLTIKTPVNMIPIMAKNRDAHSIKVPVAADCLKEKRAIFVADDDWRRSGR